jgi:hypothetical protein
MPTLKDFLLRLRLCRERRNLHTDSENDRDPISRMDTSVEDGWRKSSKP